MPLRPVRVTHDDDPQRQAPFADPLRQRLDVARALLRADRAQHADVPDPVVGQLEDVGGATLSVREMRRPRRRNVDPDVREVFRQRVPCPMRRGEYPACLPEKGAMSPAPGDDVDLVQAIEFREAASAGRAVGRSVAIDTRAVDEHDGRAWQVHVPHRIAIGNRGSFEHRCQVVAAVDQAVHVDEPDAKPGIRALPASRLRGFRDRSESRTWLARRRSGRSRARHRA